MTLAQMIHTGWRGTSLTPLNEVDMALAHALNQQQASADVRHLWLVALVSHQWGRGHACLDLQAWPNTAHDLLGWNDAALAAIPANLREAIASLPWAKGEGSPLVVTGDRVYLRRAWLAEQRIRQQLLAMQQNRETPNDIAQQLQRLFGNNPDDQQLQACAHAAANALTVITGGPGTGKTTTVVKLLRILQAGSATPLRTLLAAPTGKAAARLMQTMAQARAQLGPDEAACLPTRAHTLHKLLFAPHGGSVHLQADVIVVDEASMIDVELMAKLLMAVPAQSRLVLLGDKDQLASVEAGAVMAQLCQAPWLQGHTQVLTHSHRFDPQQGIGAWARACLQGDRSSLQQLWQDAPEGLGVSPDGVSKLTALHSHSPSTLQAIAQAWSPWQALLAPHQQGAACDDVQALALLHSFARVGVLCALREGPWGVKQINTQLQQALGFAHSEWFVGRPVMARRNDYALGLMNGDMGMCLPTWVDGQVRVRVAFPDGQGGVRWLVTSRLEDVDTVFAMTVHQSQGSEFEQVLLILPDLPTPVLSREWVYTGITRARQQLCVWAPQPALLMNAIQAQLLRSGGLADDLP